MPDVNAISNAARDTSFNFTGFLSHAKAKEIAEFWAPNMFFHEMEMFHPIDFEDLYTKPSDVFNGVGEPDDLSEAERNEYRISTNTIDRTPPVIGNFFGESVDNGKLFLRGQHFNSGSTAQNALLEESIDAGALYTHGRTTKAADRFFGSQTVDRGTENPSRARLPIKVRAEVKMLLDTQAQDLDLSVMADENSDIDKPIDAIWGDFDITELLLKREQINQDGTISLVTPSRQMRQQFARDVIRAFQNGETATLDALLASPPTDNGAPTFVNRTVWTALSQCCLVEFNYIYAYNDFARYGGFWTNEHEGDNEGCCLVFQRTDLAQFQNDQITVDQLRPIGIITSVHEPSNRADEYEALPDDPTEARDATNVYIALGSHATYLSPGDHDFFDITDLAREDLAKFIAGLLVLAAIHPLLLAYVLWHAHFKDTKDKTTENGTKGFPPDDPRIDNDLSRPIEVLTTPLSQFGFDENIYDLTRDDNPLALARRAYQGRMGAHVPSISLNLSETKANFVNDSPKWSNKTRRFFRHLVKAIGNGKFRDPSATPTIVE